ncbi:hypothetical protein C8Q70DRAFT_1054109 [Cubamyces menziesii]|uniref:Mob1/phocein n=1 Tax=Trametes cubensis TaxID=1111947 RepID=A0AAD7TX69_9APHY|nr:hypothetical protein C8Q70DRAFT_1054109 [Cubamyces menziesii]KAJ8488034.1 hypothetical protein ONZ51_g3827 [Trametes cubensis]
MAVAIQRPLKGSRISSFYPVKSLPPLSSLDSAFQLQEYISLLIRLDVHNVERIVSIPGKDQNEGSENGAKADEKDGEKDAAGGVHVDPACWIYEHLRRVAQDLSHPLITMLQQECTRTTCPEMKAGEWLYLCVAHGNESAMEQCCAIDYILHTLDSATALLNSPRAFPSRLSVPSTSQRHFSSLCRRLGRIFAHAYFHHREIFEQAEAESSLYARFLALVKYFDLVPLDFLVIPPLMEGRAEPVEPPRLMGASLEPRKDTGPSREEGGSSTAWPGAQEGGLRADRGKSPPGPAGQTRNESPRKFGRARTDTMVYSEAFSVAEELAKGDLSEVDIDREIAAERAMATAIPQPPYIIPVHGTESSAVTEAEQPEDPPRRITAETFVPPEEGPATEPTTSTKEEVSLEPQPSSHDPDESSAPPKAWVVIPPPSGPYSWGRGAPYPEAQTASDEQDTVKGDETDASPAEEPPATSADESSSSEPPVEEAGATVESKAEEEETTEESEVVPPAPPTTEETSPDPEPPANAEVEAEAEPEAELEPPTEPITVIETPSDEPAPEAPAAEVSEESKEEPSESTETPSEAPVADTEEPSTTTNEGAAEKTSSEEEPASEGVQEPEDAASAESS